MTRPLIMAFLAGMIAAVSLVAASDFTKPKAKGRLSGKLRDLTYIAPQEVFRLPTPVDGDWGGIVEDKPGYVAFSDDAGQLFRIEYIDYAADFDRVRTELGDRTFFERMITNFYLPKTILVAAPDAKFVAQSYVESPEPMLISCWFVPKGSNIINVHNGISKRLDTYRSVAVLVRKPRLYFVSLTPSSGKVVRFGADAEKQLWPGLEEATQKFIGSIQFKSP